MLDVMLFYVIIQDAMHTIPQFLSPNGPSLDAFTYESFIMHGHALICSASLQIFILLYNYICIFLGM